MRKSNLIHLIAVASLMAQPSCIDFTPVIQSNNFILVTDVSGSMDGEPMEHAKEGLFAFLDQMNPNDKAALISFSDQISVKQTLSSDVGTLKRVVQSLYSGGGTHLYDAVAKAIEMSNQLQGNAAIVLLTDGQDGGSRFSSRHIESMLAYHGVIFYALGLGSVDKAALDDLAAKTSGTVEYTSESATLRRLYPNTLQIYRQKHGSPLSTAQVLIHSMPAGRPVLFDGKEFGNTPLKLSNIMPGNHEITINFDAGPWRCSDVYQAGMAGKIRASESDVDRSIAVISIPHGCAVFLDDEFQGYTSNFMVKSNTETSGFLFKKKTTTKDYSRELILANVPKGKHELKIIPFAGSDIEGDFDLVSYEFTMGDKDIVITADGRTGRSTLEAAGQPLKAREKRFKLDESTIFDDF